MQTGQAKVWTFMVQDVGVCSEGSRVQLHHKAGFVLKGETERGEGKKLKKKNKTRIDRRKPGNCVLIFHSCDSDSLSEEVS